jgi:two-component system, OmpR family, KDP operon response regulator KdpE
MRSVPQQDALRHVKPELGVLLAIIDEDAGSSRRLQTTLEAAQYRCLEFRSFLEFERQVEVSQLSAFVLDLAAAELDRLGAIRSIRAASEAPILIVTERADERDKVSALDAGADDYLVKPLGAGEFLARVRVALRHGRARRGLHGGRVEVGDLVIDLPSREVSVRRVRLTLTPTDYKLLALLARNVGRVVPRQRLLHEAWGPNARDPHYLRVYMARLRRKLDPERAGVRYIVTEAGVGYRLLAQLRA